MNYKKAFLFLSHFFLILSLLSCIPARDREGPTAGGGSEGEMKIYGIVTDSSDTPIEGALARLYRLDEVVRQKDSTKIDSTYTDPLGIYTFKVKQIGKYSIEIVYIIDTDTLTANIDTILIDEIDTLKNYYLGESTLEKKSNNSSTLPKPIAYWDFEKTSDTLWDLSGNNLHGSIEGAEITDGIEGKALYFHHDKKASVTVKQSPLLESNKGRTMSLWVKADPVQTDSNATLLRKSVHWGNGYALYWGRENDKVTFVVDYHNVTVIDPKYTAQYGTMWTYITTVQRENGSTELYINGELVGQQTLTKAEEHSGDFKIGGMLAGTEASGWVNTYFNGIIDEVKIFDTALSIEQIDELYQKHKL